jgi:hypothetical protein
MAILIRETKVLGGKEYQGIKVFKSEKFPITSFEELNAIRLDEFLSTYFEKIIKETKRNRLIELKGKNGSIELWYFIGEKLKFIDDSSIVNPADKKFIWKALWYHAGDLRPGEMGSRAGTVRDHFYYCYRIAKYDKEFVLRAGNWRAWLDFFDSPTLSNKYCLEWFEKKSADAKKINSLNWLRRFIKLVRNEFLNKDMSFLSKQEINKVLDKLFDLINKQPIS